MVTGGARLNPCSRIVEQSKQKTKTKTKTKTNSLSFGLAKGVDSKENDTQHSPSYHV
jgi:hypothetical protein